MELMNLAFSIGDPFSEKSGLRKTLLKHFAVPAGASPTTYSMRQEIR